MKIRQSNLSISFKDDSDGPKNSMLVLPIEPQQFSWTIRGLWFEAIIHHHWEGQYHFVMRIQRYQMINDHRSRIECLWLVEIRVHGLSQHGSRTLTGYQPYILEPRIYNEISTWSVGIRTRRCHDTTKGITSHTNNSGVSFNLSNPLLYYYYYIVPLVSKK